jgi:hypothetical protein
MRCERREPVYARAEDGSPLREKRLKPHLPDTRHSTQNGVLVDIYRHIWRTLPHLPDRNATAAGPQRHTWRTPLPQLPDRDRSKSLIQIRKDSHKVSKVLKDREDQDLTYQQKVRS